MSIESDRWRMRYKLPLLIEPDGQRVVTRQGARGLLVSLTDAGGHVAYQIITDEGDALVALATDVDLEIAGEKGSKK